jgi:hypothetical protein
MINENLELENATILPLFTDVEISHDYSLTIEAMDTARLTPRAAPKSRPILSETQFPDQSIYTLNDQLRILQMNLERLKFYLSDMDDLLPG